MIGLDLPTRVVDAVHKTLPPRRPIHHHEPFLYPQDILCVAECMKDGIASDYHVKTLEDRLARYCGVRNVISTSSGSAALHVALLAAGVKAGEEVLVPSLTFIATASAVVYCGAVPNFCDGFPSIKAYKLRRYLEKSTTSTPDKRGRLNSRTGRVISALIVVDLLGFPADWPKLSAVAKEFGLILIEDASQALGARLGDQKCGSFGDVATLSFNNNKIITGNGGGAILTNDEWIASKAYQLTTTARTPHPWKVEHTQIAYNYRMPSICASLITSQLNQIDKIIGSKHVLMRMYKACFDALPVEIVQIHEVWQGHPNYWLISILVEAEFKEEILNGLHKKGILARALFTPLHKLPIFEGNPQDENLKLSEISAASTICLPSGVGLVS